MNSKYSHAADVACPPSLNTQHLAHRTPIPVGIGKLKPLCSKCEGSAPQVYIIGSVSKESHHVIPGLQHESLTLEPASCLRGKNSFWNAREVKTTPCLLWCTACDRRITETWSEFEVVSLKKDWDGSSSIELVSWWDIKRIQPPHRYIVVGCTRVQSCGVASNKIIWWIPFWSL